MERVRQDIRTASAARMFKDAEGDVPARVSAKRHGVARRTAQNWREVSHPAVRAFLEYLSEVPDSGVYRVLAEIQAHAKWRTVRGDAIADLLIRHGDLLQLERDIEAEDSKLDVNPSASWSDRALASARDSAINAEKQAIELELATRGVSWVEVMTR